MVKLNIGTKEIVVVSTGDRLAEITDLGPYNVEQKIISEDEQTVKQNWTTVLETSVMDAHCLIDTTGWAEGTYKLYVRINVPPELPILGPEILEVS